MQADFFRNLRLVVATSLLSLWGFSHLAETPVLGDTVLPLVVALVIAPGSIFGEWRRSRYGAWLLVAGLFMFAALTAALHWLSSEQSLSALSRSPFLIIPLWTLALIGLVRNATTAERLAFVSVAPVSAHAPDAAWLDGKPSPADAAPALSSNRRRS